MKMIAIAGLAIAAMTMNAMADGRMTPTTGVSALDEIGVQRRGSGTPSSGGGSGLPGPGRGETRDGWKSWKR